jgi:methylenetetrahydrofolate dehydrogenase (NADP+)/methenyltetrahydrofolate cyclohydrolase
MSKILNGRDLSDYIKQRQEKDVRNLLQAHHLQPKLAIVLTVDNPVTEVYLRLKQKYGTDLGVAVQVHRVKQAEAPALIKKLNKDTNVHGIIVQLPLEDPSQTDEIVNLVVPAKDVDALGAKAIYEPATPLAIMWLLAGYNVELKNKRILLIGKGKLVGAPLLKLMKASGLDVEAVGRETKDLAAKTLAADIIITATGSPAILTSDMIKPDAVVVDAGVASEGGKTVGDLAPDVYERDDLKITPTRGGVGPLTVCALFENVIRATRQAND